MGLRAIERALVVLLILLLPFYRVLAVKVGSVSLSVVDCLIVIGAVLSGLSVPQRLRLPSIPKTAIVGALILLAASLGSFLASTSLSTSAQAVASIVLKFLLTWLIVHAVRHPQDVREISGTYVAAACVLAGVALSQQVANILARRALESVAGTFEARNELIYYLVPGFVLAIALAWSAGRRAAALRLWIGAGIIFAGIGISRGRGGLAIATMLGIGIMPFLPRRTRNRRGLIFGAFSLAAIGVLFAVAPEVQGLQKYYEDYASRYAVSSVEEELSDNRGSAFIRVQVLRGVADAWRESPYVGIGLGTFKDRSAEFVHLGRQATNAIQPHNTYLGLLAEAGPLSLLGFLSIVAAGLLLLFNIGAYDFANRALALGVATAFVAVSLNLLIFDGLTRYAFWLFLGLSLALTRMAAYSRHITEWYQNGFPSGPRVEVALSNAQDP